MSNISDDEGPCLFMDDESVSSNDDKNKKLKLKLPKWEDFNERSPKS